MLIHILLLTAVAELWCGKTEFSITSAPALQKQFIINHKWRGKWNARCWMVGSHMRLQKPTTTDYSVSQEKSPLEIFWHFFPNGWDFLVQILHAYYTFLSMLDCKFLFSYLQLWRSYAILSVITMICSKCPPSTEMHPGWHNFVVVGDNWVKICSLTSIGMCYTRVKFGLKISNCLGKMSENASVRFGRWWTFCA